MTIEERNKLFEDNINIIRMVLSNQGIHMDNDDYEDLFQECSIFILDRLPNWTPDRGAITTYIAMLTDYAIRTWRHDKSSLIPTISENTPSYIDSDGDALRLCDTEVYADSTDIISDCCTKCDIDCLFKKAESAVLKDGRHKRTLKNLHLVKERYLEGKSVIELAEKYGTTRQCINRKIYTCMELLRKVAKGE